MGAEEKLLRDSKIIAVVGLSPDPDKPSHRVASYLKEHGYRIIPVNPSCDRILGERCYPSLSAVPEPVDLVDIFRRPDQVGPIVEEAIAAKARAVWMQLGVVNPEAARRAESAGLSVVMDKCLMKEHIRLFGQGKKSRMTKSETILKIQNSNDQNRLA